MVTWAFWLHDAPCRPFKKCQLPPPRAWKHALPPVAEREAGGGARSRTSALAPPARTGCQEQNKEKPNKLFLERISYILKEDLKSHQGKIRTEWDILSDFGHFLLFLPRVACVRRWEPAAFRFSSLLEVLIQLRLAGFFNSFRLQALFLFSSQNSSRGHRTPPCKVKGNLSLHSCFVKLFSRSNERVY